MLTEYEATKLQRDMHEELDDATGALLKSVIGMLVVVLLALLGPSLDLGHEPAAGQPGAQASMERQ